MQLVIYPLRKGMEGDAVNNLHEVLFALIEKDVLEFSSSASDQNVLRALEEDQGAKSYRTGTVKTIHTFQNQQQIPSTGEVDKSTAELLNEYLRKFGLLKTSPKFVFTVEGKVNSRSRPGVGQLIVLIMDKNAGPDEQLAKITTDKDGAFEATFTYRSSPTRKKTQPDVQAMVYAGSKLVGSSAVRYHASNHETLNVVLETEQEAQLESEYDTLIHALTAQVAKPLRELKEDDERTDITYLANKTGWDARAVALAALADEFSEASGTANGQNKIPSSLFYSLFRAGVPANEAGLYQTDANAVKGIWEEGIKQGIVPKMRSAALAQAQQQFQVLATQQALKSPALQGLSSLKEMLTVSLGNDAAKHQEFTELHLQFRNDPGKLWNTVKSKMGPATETRLRVDGQLAVLTMNNAPLIKQLHEHIGPTRLNDPKLLVQHGYYRAQDWKTRLGTGPIPPEIPGATLPEKRQRYADLLAEKVRLSFPTAVIGQMVKDEELALRDAGLKNQVHQFLSGHEEEFSIDRQPVEQFLRLKQISLDTVNAKMLEEVKRIQRIKHLVPHNDLISPMMKANLDSAVAIVRYSPSDFQKFFAKNLGGELAAQSIYRKAEQVHLAMMNTAVSFLWARTSPSLGQTPGLSGGMGDPGSGLIINPTPQVPDQEQDTSVIAYPTLESLFGELDYCACEHCRSILSPAAYLVNLLQFLEYRPEAWNKFLQEWPESHSGAGYPFLDEESWKRAGSSQNFSSKSPLDILLSRRPDLEHLPLTCENTNTALPYIDVVNETLEHYVAHIENDQPLSGYQGHSTPEGVTSEELLAAPQFVQDDAYQKVQDDANKTLAEASFPLGLPFHQPLELLRRYFTRFDLNLSDVMETLYGKDVAGEQGYEWTDIVVEEAGISPQAYELFTNTELKLWQLYGFPKQGDAAIRTRLAKAKDFSRRMGISYADVVAVLKTRFVNPQARLLPKLDRLGVPIIVLTQFKNRQLTNRQLLERLPDSIDPSLYVENIPKWINDHYDDMMTLILLTDPAQPQGAAIDHCSFEQFEFLHANGNKLSTIECYKLHYLLRLTYLLGWSYEQVDQAIAALVPELFKASTRKALSDGFTKLVPRLGVLLRVIRQLGLNLQKDLPALLACFSSLETYGPSALYRRMFLTGSLTDQDAAFADNGSGEFLTDNSAKLLDHKETLRAAFSLTSEEFTAIVQYFTFTEATALTLENISAVFRHGWLAKQLHVSVVELLRVLRRTGLKPFDLSNSSNPSILQFMQFFSHLRTTGLPSATALYLLWHEDLTGSLTPSPDEVLGLMRTVRADLTAIEQEFTVLDDPNGEKTREKMALVYGTDATNRFFRILESQVVIDVDYTHHQSTLEPEIVAAGEGTLSYDSFAKRLRYTGWVMTPVQRDALRAVSSFSGITKFKQAIDDLYRQSRQVFDDHPELEDIAAIHRDPTGSQEEIRAAVLKALLPDLVRRRKQQQAIQILSGAAKVDGQATTTLVQSVLQAKKREETETVFILHAVGDVSQPAVHDLTAIEEQGLSAKFYFEEAIPDGESTSDHSLESGAGLTYAGDTGPKSLPRHPTAGKAISGKWDGWVEVPHTGLTQFRIVTDPKATVTFELNKSDISLQFDTDRAVWTHQFPVDLQAGILYPISLTVQNVTNRFQVRWKSPMGSWEEVPLRSLYAKARVEPFHAQYIRFMKIASLAATVPLSAEELAYVGTQEDLRSEGQNWLNSLPVRAVPTESSHNSSLFKGLLAILDMARVKATLGQQGAQFLKVLQDPAAKNEQGEVLLHALMRWTPESVTALFAHFNLEIQALGHPSVFARVHDAMRACQQSGVSADALIQATTNDPSPDVLRNFQSALRARYDHSTWLEVLKPIHDDLRRLRRDALVTYLLHHMHNQPDKQHIDTPEKLFEFFLMDVQMDPCMQTSRIRHALSSIQLFIERCLMNLEPQVAPSALDSEQWEWMKRYRVWEANRKVFLYPENWLEPELRDNQSPFFQEMMSELLQSDITEDRAATALLGYLSKLDEVAKLEPCGLHVQEGKEEAEGDIVHVVARTSGTGRKFFYRRRNPSGWTPWEQIHLDIEDTPVLPVVWNDRLFLFWLKILQQGPEDLGTYEPTPGPQHEGAGREKTVAESTASDMQKTAQENGKKSTRVSVQAILCWSEHFNGKWQPTRTSDVNRSVHLGIFPGTGKHVFDRAKLRFFHIIENNGLRLICEITSGPVVSFLLRNTHSLPEYDSKPWDPIVDYFKKLPVGYLSRDYQDVSQPSILVIDYFRSHNRLLPSEVRQTILEQRDNSISSRPLLIPSKSLTQSPWYYPILFSHGSHVFYVRVSKEKFFLVGDLPENWWNSVYDTTWQVPKMEGLVFDASSSLTEEQTRIQQWNIHWDDVITADAMKQIVQEVSTINKGLSGFGAVEYKGITIHLKGGVR